MFTGIVEEIGVIVKITRGAHSGQMVVQAKMILEDCKIGDSISINGACLTVVAVNANNFAVDVSPETLRRTNLGDLTSGSKVNLERSLRLQDRLGGHLVLGHVDEVGVISRLQDEDTATLMQITVSHEAMRYIVQKGSICVNGVSLTISNLSANAFEVSLIPYTKSVTTLGEKKTNDRVNIEVDILGRYVERLLSQNLSFGQELSPGSENINMEFLREHGFS